MADERKPTICLSCMQPIPFAEYPEHRAGCQRDIAESNARLSLCECGHTAEAHAPNGGACTSWRPAYERWCDCRSFTDGDLRHILITICQPCLDGEGEECHTPGCALWMHKVDLRIDPVLYEVVAADDAAGAAGPQATPDQVLWECETIPLRRTANPNDESVLRVNRFVNVPSGTRVRVVAVPTGQEDQT